MKIDKSINIFGKKLKSCCDNPKTGFFRDGYCNTCPEDHGMHTVCILITEDFLNFSKYAPEENVKLDFSRLDIVIAIFSAKIVFSKFYISLI